MTAILSPDELAASLYRAFCAALAIGSAPWEHLPLEHQAPWLRVALHGEQTLLACEGKSYAQAGEALARLQCANDPEALELAVRGTRNRTAYEALARHFMTLIDGEGLPDLAELEARWGPWALGKFEIGKDPFLVEYGRDQARA